ncbi:hypothetical protein [Silvanigrella sp.]|jgi:hypothetical protein|uniref:hypothetical protein n=1 Tax=Silvanigrella sp. TaxID=2024976 RepID=UPI0037C62FFC
MSNRYSENLAQVTQTIKTFIFGENNSRLDYLIKNFYRLNHERRSLIIVSSIISAIVLFTLTIIIYLVGLFSLQNKLSSAYSNSNALKEVRPAYVAVQTNFDELENGIKSTNANLSLISLLDQKAKDLGLQISGFPVKPIISKLPNQNPLAEQFQKVSVDFKLSGVSLKKMMEYINSAEQMPNKLKVSKFRLISITEAKLYFDVLLTVEGLMPIEKQNNSN